MDYLGIDKAHLIGQSYGGDVVFDFAVAHPDLAELDLNPVMPYGDRVVAVDAVMVWQRER